MSESWSYFCHHNSMYYVWINASGLWGMESFGCNRLYIWIYLSAHPHIFPKHLQHEGISYFLSHFDKKSLCMGTRGNSWVTFHKFSSTATLAQGSWEWLWDSPSLAGNTGTVLWGTPVLSNPLSGQSQDTSTLQNSSKLRTQAHKSETEHLK